MNTAATRIYLLGRIAVVQQSISDHYRSIGSEIEEIRLLNNLLAELTIVPRAETASVHPALRPPLATQKSAETLRSRLPRFQRKSSPPFPLPHQIHDP